MHQIFQETYIMQTRSSDQNAIKFEYKKKMDTKNVHPFACRSVFLGQSRERESKSHLPCWLDFVLGSSHHSKQPKLTQALGDASERKVLVTNLKSQHWEGRGSRGEEFLRFQGSQSS